MFQATKKLPKLVEEIAVDFEWHPGMAASQKQKSVKSLHAAARGEGISKILEVSSKSEEQIGVSLSAFNLEVELSCGRFISLESAFQGSKVYDKGGPYLDMYGKHGRDLKKDPRIRDGGILQCFEFEGECWELEPKTSFYDWLYLRAVRSNEDLAYELCRSYEAFTDIEFNPKKSINCQARSCALFVSLWFADCGLLDRSLNDRELFLKTHLSDSNHQSHCSEPSQDSLPGIGS